VLSWSGGFTLWRVKAGG